PATETQAVARPRWAAKHPGGFALCPPGVGSSTLIADRLRCQGNLRSSWIEARRSSASARTAKSDREGAGLTVALTTQGPAAQRTGGVPEKEGEPPCDATNASCWR